MRNIRQLLVAFLMSVVVACGGGGTLGSSGTPETPKYAATIKLLDASGSENSTLTSSAPLTVEYTLTSSNGGNISGQLISFELSDSAVATFNNGTSSAVTNSSGVAKIGLIVGTKSGAATVSATLPDNSKITKAFNSAGDNPAADVITMTLGLVDSAGKEVTSVSKDKPAKARATLKSKLGLNVSGKQVNFTMNLPDLARFGNSAGTAQTNSAGIAEIALEAGTASGAGTLTAVLNGNNAVTASKAFDSAGDGGAVTTDPVSTVLLQSDKLQLGSGNADKVELTAIVRDRQQNLLKNVAVKFGIETGFEGEIEVQSATTDNTGTARAVLTTKTNPALRDILVSATAGSSTAKSYLTLKVVGTDIEIAAAPAVVLGSSIDMTFTVLDSSAKPIRDTVLALSSELKNSFSNTSPRTDAATGRVTVRYTAATSGKDIVTVSALGLSRSVPIVVNSDAFAYVKPSGEAEILEIPLNTVGNASVKWTRNGSPMVGQDVGFTTTRGAIAGKEDDLAGNRLVATIPTDSTGTAKVFMSSALAGFASISASTRGTSDSLQTQKIVEFIATVPDPKRPLEVQAIPAQLAPGDKALVQAIVRDTNNNPVKNKDVAFSLVDSFGGQISPAIARTNSAGVATTEFTADVATPGSGTPQEPKGLKIKATIADDDKISGTTPIAVGNRTLFFRFATGNKIREDNMSINYLWDYAVLVTDSTGNPVANQSLTVSVLPKRYHKGMWFKRPVNASFKYWEPVQSNDYDDPSCLSEDTNRNGIKDDGEDQNGDGMLTPGNVVSVAKTITADANGIAYFTLTYAKEMAGFVEVDVTVSGAAAGSENVTSRLVWLAWNNADTTDESDRPWNSPFGVDAVVDENDTKFITTSTCKKL